MTYKLAPFSLFNEHAKEPIVKPELFFERGMSLPFRLVGRHRLCVVRFLLQHPLQRELLLVVDEMILQDRALRPGRKDADVELPVLGSGNQVLVVSTRLLKDGLVEEPQRVNARPVVERALEVPRLHANAGSGANLGNPVTFEHSNIQTFEHFPDRLLRQNHVGIENDHPLRRRRAPAKVALGAALRTLVQHLRPEFRGNPLRRIRRVVVDDDDLDLVANRVERADAVRDVRLLVARGDDDGQFHFVFILRLKNLLFQQDSLYQKIVLLDHLFYYEFQSLNYYIFDLVYHLIKFSIFPFYQMGYNYMLS